MAVITTLGVPDNTGNTTTIMPKLQYRFRATFIGEGFTATPTRSVISVSRPSLTHDEIPLDMYNSRIFLAGKHTWEPITVVLRDDVDSVVIRELNGQLNRQVDHANQSSPRSGSAYKFQLLMETLDGASPTPGILDKFELAGAYIQNIQYGDMAYASSDQVQVTVSIRYDNAEIYDAAGNATLTGAAQDQTLSNATGAGTAS
jgi:hypothetical protein